MDKRLGSSSLLQTQGSTLLLSNRQEIDGRRYSNKPISLRGVVVPMATPVRRSGEVDFDGLVKLAEWLAANGVNGLFLAGTCGRFSHFSPEQNMHICSAVAKAVGSQVTIYGGACDSGLYRILENTRMMEEAGAHVVVTTPPYYLSYSEKESEQVLRKVAELSPLPVVYYSIPQFVGYGLRAEFVAEMADHPNVVGYKDSTGDLAHHMDILARTKDKDFDVLIGRERKLAGALKAGSKGLVVAFGNAYPGLFVELVKAAEGKNWQRVNDLQASIAKIVDEYYAHTKSKLTSMTLMLYLQALLNQQDIKIMLSEDT